MTTNYIPNGYTEFNAVSWGEDLKKLTVALPDGRVVWVHDADKPTAKECIVWDAVGNITFPSNYAITQRMDVTATAGQTVFAIAPPYAVGTNSLEVYVNGLRQRYAVDYTETDAMTVTFLSPLTVGDKVSFYSRYFQQQGPPGMVLPGLGGTGQNTSATTGQPEIQNGTWLFPENYINVASKATGGDGTIGDPWTGWDTVIDWTTTAIRVFRPGIYKFTSNITVSAGSLKGAGYGINTGTSSYGSTVLLKTGDFDGISLTGSGCIVENLQLDGDTGNTLDGLVVTGSRNHIQNVSITRMGGVGLRIGDKTAVAGNSNLNRLTNVLTLGNGSHGLYVHDADATPNANSLIVSGIDTRGNGGDGIAIENAIDGQYFGVHTASNTGYGIRLYSGAKGHGFWMPYIEANTAGELQADAGSGQNVVWGTRNQSADAYVDNGTGNLILGRASEKDLFFLRSALSFLKLNIDNPGISGQWELRQNASDRSLEIAAVNTASTPLDVSFVHDTAGSVRLKADALIINSGGSTSISTGIGNVRMSDTTDRNNTAWIPIILGSTTYYVPAWTSHG